MTFFQDYAIPAPPPRPRMPQFTPPPWAAPPRYELPALVPVSRFVHKSPSFVLAVEAVEVYSTGCIIDVNWILRRTHQEDRKWAEINAVFHRPAPQVRDGGISADSILLLGVQFPDGRKSSSSSLSMYGHRPLDQEPDGPVFEYRPKGGDAGEDDMSANAALWLWPLPPAGDLRLVAQGTDMGMPESSISTAFSFEMPLQESRSTGLTKTCRDESTQEPGPARGLHGRLLLRPLRRHSRRCPRRHPPS